MRSLFTVVTLAVSAICATPNTGSAAALSFDCDTPGNRYSILSMDLDTPLRISGVIEPVLLRSGDFLPAATIKLANDAGDIIGLQLVAQNRRSERLEVYFIVRGEGDMDQRRVAQVNRDPQPFLLTVSADGKTRLEIAGSSFDAETLPVDTATVSVACSTGEFKFSDLKLEGDPPSED